MNEQDKRQGGKEMLDTNGKGGSDSVVASSAVGEQGTKRLSTNKSENIELGTT